MVRKVVAVFAGIVVGMITMFIGVTISTVMYRPEDPQSLQDPEAFQQFVERLPPMAFVIVLGAHVAGTLVGDERQSSRRVAPNNRLRGRANFIGL